MTFAAFSHAMFARAPNPLAKLVLMRFADGCDGAGELEPERYAEFCCATAEEVRNAVCELVETGFLAQHGPKWFSLVGYTPWEPHPDFPSYVKRKLPKGLKTKVLDRDARTCRRCGAKDDLCIDHIMPERHGGTDDIANLQVLCRSCNSRKKDRLP